MWILVHCKYCGVTNNMGKVNMAKITLLKIKAQQISDLKAHLGHSHLTIDYIDRDHRHGDFFQFSSTSDTMLSPPWIHCQ